MKDNQSKFILIIFICLFNVMCTNKSDINTPKTNSNILNEFVQSTSVQSINLDNGQVTKSTVSSNEIIYNTKTKLKNDSLTISQIDDFTYFGNDYHVYDSFQNSIFVIDSSGSFQAVVGREGKGPGEYLYVTSIRSNSNTLFVADVNNARINRYDYKLNRLGALQPFISNPSSSKIDLNNSIFLSGNSESAGFNPNEDKSGLIVINKIENMQDTLGTILPRIIPRGYQPAVFNQVSFSLNQNNQIAATYRPLPWIFIFDEDQSLVKVIVLEYTVFNEMNLPELELFLPKGNEGYGGTIPINDFELLNNGDILISIREVLFHLKSKRNNGYTLQGKYVFNISESDTSIRILNLEESHNGSLVGSNWNYLFEFNLPNK